MRILYCHLCNEVFRIDTKERTCSCGKSGVLYRIHDTDVLYYYGNCTIYLFVGIPETYKIQKIKISH